MTISNGPDPVSSPKLFVSYCWTNPDHEAWVLRLATELRDSGVDAILDKWDLRAGHDAHSFMEKMVTDPEVKKVILICDRAYAEKADNRKGGVGKEAQIISGTIYEKQDQEKFVAIVKERDDVGKAYVPAYYRSRIYLDFSDPTAYSSSFDKLLRWIYDQPLDSKPELGSKPQFLVDELSGAIALGTSSRLRRALDAIRNSRDHAIPATDEYFQLLAEQFEKFRIDPASDPFDEAVVKSIESFLPYRNEAIQTFEALATYIDNQESRTVLHGLFERLGPYGHAPVTQGHYREWDFDNFRFLIQELFLYAIASLVRHERFESAAHLMGTQYYLPHLRRAGHDVMASFDIFRRYLRSLEFRNSRLGLRRLSLTADFLKDRCSGTVVRFQDLMQADYILFLRSRTNDDRLHFWFPDTLVYSHEGPFEVFVRSRSRNYFERAKILVGIGSKEEFESLIVSVGEAEQVHPRWGYEAFNDRYLSGVDAVATRP